MRYYAFSAHVTPRTGPPPAPAPIQRRRVRAATECGSEGACRSCIGAGPLWMQPRLLQQARDARMKHGADHEQATSAERHRGSYLSPIWILAYVALPALWSHHEHEPGLASLPMVTRTASGIPGDALNVGLVGTKKDVLGAMHAAGWFPADPITPRSGVEIVGSVILDRPYHDAPASPLYYQGKKEQLAFEKPDGRSADRRHHVRFYARAGAGNGQPSGVARVSHFRPRRGAQSRHRTGHLHHIAPDIDAERDLLMQDLRAAGMVQNFFQSIRHEARLCSAEMGRVTLLHGRRDRPRRARCMMAAGRKPSR